MDLNLNWSISPTKDGGVIFVDCFWIEPRESFFLMGKPLSMAFCPKKILHLKLRGCRDGFHHVNFGQMMETHVVSWMIFLRQTWEPGYLITTCQEHLVSSVTCHPFGMVKVSAFWSFLTLPDITPNDSTNVLHKLWEKIAPKTYEDVDSNAMWNISRLNNWGDL